MTDLFYTVLRMSGYGLVAALAMGLVIALFWRTRCSKTALLLLWAVAAFRLLCPWSLSSPLSLFNWASMDRYASQAVDTVDHIYTGDARRAVDAESWSHEDYERVTSAGAEPVRNPSTGLMEAHYYEDETTGAIPPAKSLRESWGPILSAVWLTGAAGFLAYGVGSYVLLRRRLRFAVKDEALPNVWYSDRISSPCVAGLFRPRVYLTFGMSETERTYVLAHERQHIKNRDHLWKIAGWIVMCVHWFNPMLWLCYRVFLWMLEEACDQRVLRELGAERKEDYGQALLSLSDGRRFRPGPSPIAFGEGETKGRVKRILKYKKPLVWLTVIALVLACAVSVCVLTSADSNEAPAGDDGAYQVSGLIHQTPLSSLSWDGFLDQCRGTQVIYTPERFYLEMEDLDVAHPIYEEMELGVDLLFMDTGNDEFDRTMNIELSEGSRGFKVLTPDGEETGYHVIEVNGRIWVGKWVTHGTVSKTSEYWYIVEASLTSAAGTAYGALSDNVVCWSIDPQISSVFSGFPFVFDVENGTRLEASCDSGSLYIYDKGAYQDQGSQVSLPDTRAIYWHPYSSDGENVDQADITFSIYQNDSLLLSGTILIRPDIYDGNDGLMTYVAQASLSDSENYFFVCDPDTTGGLITDQPLSSLPASDGALLATWYADLTHDGVDETITVSADDASYDLYHVTVTNRKGETLWSDLASAYVTDWHGFYLYEQDGQAYLVDWVCSNVSSIGPQQSYRVFSLTAQGEEVVLAENSIHAKSDDPLEMDVAALQAFEDEASQFLDNGSTIALVSTNPSTSIYYSTPDNPIISSSSYTDLPHYAAFYRLEQAAANGTVLAAWYADLTHDGVDETITVSANGESDPDVYYITVSDRTGTILWNSSAATVHVGQNGIYLYQQDGLYYLMQWVPYSNTGATALHYRIFSLTEAGDEIILARNSFDYILISTQELLDMDVNGLRAFEAEINALLADSVVLLSTNGDTPSGVYYSTPESPVTPDWFDSGADEIASRQATANGTVLAAFTSDLPDRAPPSPSKK